MEKSDILYYMVYGLVIVMAGVFVFLFTLGKLGGWEAFTAWFLSVGIILIGGGCVKVKKDSKGSLYLMGAGAFLIVVSSSVLAAVLKTISIWSAIAVIIIFIGLGVLTYGIIGKGGRIKDEGFKRKS